MRIDFGTAYASGQVSNTADPIIAFEFHARSTNVNSVYVGVSDVSTTNGRELPPGEAFAMHFSQMDKQGGPGSVPFSQLYVSLQGTDAVDWTVVIR